MALTPKPTPPNGALLLGLPGKEPLFVIWNHLVKRPLDDGWHNYLDFSKVLSTGVITAATDGTKWLKADCYNGETVVFRGYVYVEDRDVNWYDVPTELIPVPEVPINFSISPTSPTELTLYWTSIPNAQMEVERSDSGTGPFTKIYTTAINSVGQGDQNLQPNTVYFYKIRGVNTTGPGPYSEVVGRRTPETPPPAPTPTPAVDITPLPVTPTISPADVMALQILASLPKPMAATTENKSWLETNLTLVLAGVGIVLVMVLVIAANRD